VGRRELPNIEVLAGVGWGIFEIFRFCPIYPAPYGFVVSTRERRILLTDDLSDIALTGVGW